MQVWKPFPELEIMFNKDNHEEWFVHGKKIAAGFSHLRLREPGDLSGQVYFASEVKIEDDKVTLKGSSPCGDFVIKMHVADDSIEIEASIQFSCSWRGGADLYLLQRPDEYTRCRFYDMMVSGWSNTDIGIVFTPLFKGDACLTFNYIDSGAVQCMGLSCPAGITKGEKDFTEGQVLSGKMSIKNGNFDMWSPEIAGPMSEREVAPKPVRPYEEYIKLWQKFTDQPGLWIDLDGEVEMGMFHRGWCRFLSEIKVSGVLAKGETQHSPLLELAWGGSANAVLMETLYRLNDPRAGKILNAILYFKDGGFMHENGSWINGYQTESDSFSDRYGRQHSETATGGVVNMMFWRCIK
ncbi:MAG: hypothetical protein ACYTFY_21925, partial [Planctomycetota bacterium]